MDKDQAKKLLSKYNSGDCTEEEAAIIEQWYNILPPSEKTLSNDQIYLAKGRVWSSINVSRVKKRFKLYYSISAAAAILILISGVFFYNRDKTVVQLQSTTDEILPAQSNAFLTLADGKKINLSNMAEGRLAVQPGAVVNKTKNGQLLYQRIDKAMDISSAEIEYNIIETPRGGIFQVVLPDGTKVWLNAASSLRYPTSFQTLKQRSVELTGEAYFEVKKDTQHPFLVKTVTQEVEVLGTHFNISSYADDSQVKTTLLEGKVKVTKKNDNSSVDQKFLIPGEQSILSSYAFSKSSVNVNTEVDWRNGRFIFKDEDIRSVMRKLSRWYDIDIEFDKMPENLRFSGKISRSKKLSEILKILTLTNDVKFKVQGRRVTVMP